MNSGKPIRTLLICPDKTMLQQFTSSPLCEQVFYAAAECSTYPATASLEGKVRQMKAEIVLLDIATDRAAAAQLIRTAVALNPPVLVAGLHAGTDPQAVVRALREGASEILCAPFESAAHETAIARIRKLVDPASAGERTTSKVIAFSSAKPGSGASTLTVQMAEALSRLEQKRVLAIDLNFGNASLGFLCNVHADQSVERLLQRGVKIDHKLWNSVVCETSAADLLTAPELPGTEAPDSCAIADLLGYARQRYGWILLDLPCALERLSTACMSEADRTFIVSTPDLASLHLARRAVRTLRQFGFESDRIQVIVNRMEQRSELGSAELRTLFDCDVHRGLPSETAELQRAMAEGRSLDPGMPLARAVESLASRLRASFEEKVSTGNGAAAKPACLTA